MNQATRSSLRAASRRFMAREFSLNFGTVGFDVGPSEAIGYFALGEEAGKKEMAKQDKPNVYVQDTSETSKLLHELLKTYWGFDSFKAGQFEVIQHVLKGSDVLAVMPTGHGKSLLYQLPPLVMGKPTLVISPLVALMEEQVTSLKQKGISAAYSGKGDAYGQDWDSLDILFMSPEALTKQIARLAYTDFGLIAIDEAHCVSEWGMQFRPKYREIAVLRETHPHVPMLAITATATPNVLKDVTETLSLKPKIVTHSFNRPNLHYSVLPLDRTTRDRVMSIVKEESCSIIYCMTIKQCESIHQHLLKRGIPVALYHGELDMPTRMANQRAFMREDVKCIVCTVAFGMGIDKPNVRHVIHMGHCKSLTDYYQQTGRAGRDGARSRCTMFISVPEVVSKSSFLLEGLTKTHTESVLGDITALIDYSEAEKHVCRREPLLGHFDENYTKPAGGCGACDNCDAGNMNFSKVNITHIANDLLRMVMRIQFVTSFDKLVATYMGDKKGYSANPYFKRGKEYTRRHVEAVLHQLRVDGYLERNLLQMVKRSQLWLSIGITKKGREFVVNRKKYKEMIVEQPTYLLLETMKMHKEQNALLLDEQRKQERSRFAEHIGGLMNYPLWEQLVLLRKQNSDKHDMSPNELLPDMALMSMCRILPSSAESFEAVEQVPKAFWEIPDKELSTVFISCIVHFCKEMGYPTDRIPVDVEDDETWAEEIYKEAAVHEGMAVHEEIAAHDEIKLSQI